MWRRGQIKVLDSALGRVVEGRRRQCRPDPELALLALPLVAVNARLMRNEAIGVLSSNMVKILRAKGQSAGWFQFLLVILWFGGEFFGAVAAVIVGFDSGPAIYLGALLGAAGGAVLGVLVGWTCRKVSDRPTSRLRAAVRSSWISRIWKLVDMPFS